MKKALIICLSLILSNQLYAQTVSEKDKKAAQQLIQDVFDDVWSEFDTTKISLYHTNDYLLLEHGLVWNNDSVRYYMVKSLQQKEIPTRTNEFDFIETKATGDGIWVAYQNYATWTMGEKMLGKMHWLESAVIVKEDGRWKIQMLHSTRVPKKEH